jgi:hypothetical protein
VASFTYVGVVLPAGVLVRLAVALSLFLTDCVAFVSFSLSLSFRSVVCVGFIFCFFVF